jgi:hypothetical protein
MCGVNKCCSRGTDSTRRPVNVNVRGASLALFRGLGKNRSSSQLSRNGRNYKSCDASRSACAFCLYVSECARHKAWVDDYSSPMQTYFRHCTRDGDFSIVRESYHIYPEMPLDIFGVCCHSPTRPQLGTSTLTKSIRSIVLLTIDKMYISMDLIGSTRDAIQVSIIQT